MSRIAEALSSDFGGVTYSPALDGKRLNGQLQRVFELMKDGQWHSLYEIANQVGGSEAGVSARLRDLRKSKFGGHTVDHRRVNGGLWEYRVHAQTR